MVTNKPKTYKYTVLRKRFLQFCKKNRVSPEEMLSYCEGRITNFPYWYVDYINYTRNEVNNRIRTGIVNKIELKDIWS